MIKVFNKNSDDLPIEIAIIKEIENDIILKIPEVKDHISKSDKRIYPGIYKQYEERIKSHIIGASAFDERTIQDIKYHEKVRQGTLAGFYCAFIIF